ncbi:lysine transporter [Escherichia coli]|uniref:Lysine transporter n=1 Tax=Escherichia coli TaxID=562 RepID=A0A2X1PTY4_ECOLX|nr:lysine transporter [Escherichia coli]
MLKTSALVRSPWCSSTRGLLSAAAVMNAVILTAVLSAGNSGMYASTRMLYTLACDGKAPRISLNCRVVACRVMRCMRRR